jgi:hypothetical protein
MAKAGAKAGTSPPPGGVSLTSRFKQLVHPPRIIFWIFSKLIDRQSTRQINIIADIGAFSYIRQYGVCA